MANSELFNQRLNRFNAVLHKQMPDRVPVFPIIEQWAHQTFGVSIVDSYLDHPEKSVEAYRKVYEHVYVDATYGDGNLKPLAMLKNFGEGIYQVTEAGVQIKGSHGLVMQEDEYPQLIADPIGFIKNTIIPRKYPIFAELSADELADLWVKAIGDFGTWAANNAKVSQMIEEELEVPVIAKGGGILAPDLIFDYMRDFAGTSVDVRRRPDEFLAACEALDPIMIQLLCSSPDPSGITFIPQHMPTYVRPKIFEKLYLPSFVKTSQALIDNGRIPCFYSENDWMPYLDYFDNLPKEGSIMCIFETGDMKVIKEKAGKHVIVGGGFPVDYLMNFGVDACIDRAKWCIDELAPGGNYVFCLDKNLLNAGDAKLENLSAVCSYVHENAIY